MRFVSGLLLMTCVMLSIGGEALAFDPGPVHLCGTLVSYAPPTDRVSGQLVIGATTFTVSSGNPVPFQQMIAPGATIGSLVCLDGTIARSETAPNLLTNFTVAPAPVVPPTAVQTPAGLPSTSTTDEQGPILAVIAVAAAVSFALLTFVRWRRA